MSNEAWRAKILAEDRDRMLRSWRELAARVETRLEEGSLAEGENKVAAVTTLLERWLDGTSSLSEVTRLLLARRQIEAEYENLQDSRERRRNCHHEAGHAGVAWLLGIKILQVSVRPDVGWGSGGSFTLDPEEFSRQDAELRALVFLAGAAALDLARDGAPLRGAETDEEEAWKAILSCRPGMGQMEAMAFLGYCRVRAGELVRRLWPAVSALADALFRRNEIPGPEAEAIIAAAVPWMSPPSRSQLATAA